MFVLHRLVYILVYWRHSIQQDLLQAQRIMFTFSVKVKNLLNSLQKDL